ncbi:MAG TPA: hypothetical protein VE465_20190 [Streptosporangiaceae bacterium]|nr:hypothetical protein [Streptosporangiaceae bacterium]
MAASVGPGGIAAKPRGIACRVFLMTPTLIGAYDKTDGRMEGTPKEKKKS